jgi:Flp pilus assembly secretin CpaC
MTRRLHVVTGVKSVYVVRTAENALAVYGTVRDRTEYDTIRRYARILPQVQKGGREANDAIPAQFMQSGYNFPWGVQFFVRVLDGSDAVVRRVTAETSVVEISRTALRNLGVQVGSVALLSETVTPGNVQVVPPPAGSPPGTPNSFITNPGSITRTIDPSFIAGS